jgi:hypothetical protein
MIYKYHAILIMALYKKIIALIIIFIIFIIILTYIKTMLLYHPIPADPDKYNRFYNKLLYLTGSADYVSNVVVQTLDNAFLDTFYIKNPDTDKCIIIFHGNAGNVSMRFDMIKFLYNYCSIVIFDYRSFGKSTGSSTVLSADNLMKDTNAIWLYVTKKLKIHPNNVSLFGESIGCSLAINLASNLSKTMDSVNYPHSLILNSPFYSLTSMIRVVFDKINISILGKLLSCIIGSEYKSDEWIQYVNHKTKIIIAHSPRDEVIPYKEGCKLFDLVSKSHLNTKFINITGTHNNLGLTDNYIFALANLFN